MKVKYKTKEQVASQNREREKERADSEAREIALESLIEKEKKALGLDKKVKDVKDEIDRGEKPDVKKRLRNE